MPLLPSMNTPIAVMSFEDSQSKPPKRACTECRQQKAKCDAHLDPKRPCTRCRKLQLDCLISTTFKRTHKRERLSELEQEAESLRKRLRTSNSVDIRSPASLYQPPTLSHSLLAPSLLPDTVHMPESGRPSDLSTAYISDREAGETTLDRELNGVQVTAKEIDQLYHM